MRDDARQMSNLRSVVVVVGIAICAVLAPSASADVDGAARAIESARSDPARLRDLLWAMPKGGVLVEVPLVSNAQILGVSGRRHPLRFYLAHHVPVALATDDEGVSRTDMTEQYELAVRVHGLGYRALKRIGDDSLHHAFVPAATRALLLRRQAAAFKRFEARWPG